MFGANLSNSCDFELKFISFFRIAREILAEDIVTLALKVITATLMCLVNLAHVLKPTKSLLEAVQSLNQSYHATAKKATLEDFAINVTKVTSGIRNIPTGFVKVVTATWKELCRMNVTSSQGNVTASQE